MKKILLLALFVFGVYYGVNNKDKLSWLVKKSQNAVKKPRIDLSGGTFSR